MSSLTCGERRAAFIWTMISPVGTIDMPKVEVDVTITDYIARSAVVTTRRAPPAGIPTNRIVAVVAVTNVTIRVYKICIDVIVRRAKVYIFFLV